LAFFEPQIFTDETQIGKAIVKTIITQTSIAILYFAFWAFFLFASLKSKNRKERPITYWSCVVTFSFGVLTAIFILILVIRGDFSLATWPKPKLSY
jgi:hypothetical protein